MTVGIFLLLVLNLFNYECYLKCLEHWLKTRNFEKWRERYFTFQAFAISAGSRVGTGNIAGVATAIVLGGPGAVFGCGLSHLSELRVHL